MSEHNPRGRASDWLASNAIIPIVLFLVVQFGTTIWWASKITVQIGYIQLAIDAQSKDSYRGVDASKDFSVRDALITTMAKKIEKLEDRMGAMERRK